MPIFPHHQNFQSDEISHFSRHPGCGETSVGSLKKRLMHHVCMSLLLNEGKPPMFSSLSFKFYLGTHYRLSITILSKRMGRIDYAFPAQEMPCTTHQSMKPAAFARFQDVTALLEHGSRS